MNGLLMDHELLRFRFRELAAEAESLTPFPEAARIAERVNEADAASTRPEAEGRPLVFALLGATGVGKSSLFNALLGQDASPVSTVERCYTREPFVAAADASRPLVAFLERHHPVWCDGVSDDLPAVLIDTPDIDGMLRGNWETTRSVLQETDVVVFVTDPDRRANLAPLRELALWAGRKHWVFVLNKADQLRDREAVRRDWDDRLREAGFEPTVHNRLVVSVRGPDQGDLEHLRQLIFQRRTESDRRSLWLRNLLGRYQHALSDELIGPVRRRTEELAQLERGHVEQVRNVYRVGLGVPLVSRALWNHLRNRTWLAVAAQGAGLLSPALWIRARFAALSQSFAIARLTRGSLVGLAAAAGAAALETMRGLAGLRRALDLMGPEVRDRLEVIHRTARRQVEDRGLARLLELTPERPATQDEAAPSGPVHIAAGPIRLDLPSRSALTTALERLGLAQAEEDEVLNELYDQTERLAADSARRAAGWFWVLIGNVLPIAALGHILYRIGWSWYSAVYLPLPFYLMAAAVFAASCLPGYWLISARVARLTRSIDLEALVQRIQSPRAVRSLRAVRDRLEQFVMSADGLARELDTLRQQLPRDAGALPFAVVEGTGREPGAEAVAARAG